jgi:hypothetical protein
VSFAEDQNGVGELGPGGEDEAFGEAVRARGQRGGMFAMSIPAPARTASNAVVNWLARSRDEESDGGGAVVEVHQQVAGLLGGPGPGRVTGYAEDVDVAVADLGAKST